MSPPENVPLYASHEAPEPFAWLNHLGLPIDPRHGDGVPIMWPIEGGELSPATVYAEVPCRLYAVVPSMIGRSLLLAIEPRSGKAPDPEVFIEPGEHGTAAEAAADAHEDGDADDAMAYLDRQRSAPKSSE